MASSKPITDYGVRRKFKLSGDIAPKDIPAVAVALAEKGIYFEQEVRQDLAARPPVHELSFYIPDELTATVDLTGETPAYDMARLLMFNGVI